jgi:hypothetical protein
VAGRRTCASVAHSTRPMPRHGVGLNELLGGGGCRCKLSPRTLAENRSGKARTRTRKLSAGPVRKDSISSGTLTETKHRFRSQRTQRMRCVGASDRLDRRSGAQRTWPKSSVNRSEKRSIGKQSNQTLFCHLTPELSRPVAGRRTRASVARARG